MKRPLPRRALIISTFPPMRCGIGSYAAQQVFALRREGLVVETAALSQFAMGMYHVQMSSIVSMLRFALAILREPFDVIYFHYVDSFLPNNPTPLRERVISLAQCLFFFYLRLKAPSGFRIVVHELVAKTYRGRVFDVARRIIFRAASEIEFHTSIERDAAQKFLRLGSKGTVVSHGRYFARRFHGDKADARRKLNLPPHDPIFLCIGFLQAHKAFDRAVAAFAEANLDNAHLYVVGTVRIPSPEILRYRRDLSRQIKATPRAHLVDAYVDDEDFDAWLCACDMLIVPYTEIWTSGVLARAALFERPVAMRRHLTLIEQAGSQKIQTFENNADLAALFRTFVKEAGREPTQQQPAQHRRARILIAAPLYGSLVRGGAESVIARFSLMLSEHYDVEVWTSGSSRLEPRNNLLLDDVTPPNANMRIRRFPANVEDEAAFAKAHRRIANGSDKGHWRRLWKKTSLTGRGMETALRDEQDRFDVIVLPHYFYGSTHRLASIAPAKTILQPFIHDEPALRTRAIGSLFAGPSLVMLNSDAELAAVRRAKTTPVFDARVIGNVVEQPKSAPTQETNQEYTAVRAAIGSERFILYIGRLTAMKNVDELIDWYRESSWEWDEDVKLVLIGDGDLPPADDDDILRFADVSEAVKWRLLNECLALVQLSVLESFSIVIMEAGLAGRPVIVHADCDATSLHVARSRGGVAVASPTLFSQAVSALLADPAQAAAMGASGREFVLSEYSDKPVRARLYAAIDEVVQREGRGEGADISAEAHLAA